MRHLRKLRMRNKLIVFILVWWYVWAMLAIGELI
jgi:hypothetical protein